MKTKVDIISGFLGAGKTTFLKKLIDESLFKEKIVIIENEFGEIGIDGSSLNKKGIEIKEINSGCICCTLVGDFSKAIQEVIHIQKPDRIIIEPSGVGKLSDIIKACQTEDLNNIIKLNSIITIVDVLKYEAYITSFGEFYGNQIKHAKTIILSRTQEVNVEKIQSTIDSIRELNHNSPIITTPWKDLLAERMINVTEFKDNTEFTNHGYIQDHLLKHKNHEDCSCGHHQVNDHHCGCNHHDHHHHHANEVFDVWGIETPRCFEEQYLKELISELENSEVYGTILRGKGILQTPEDGWIQFDYVPSEINIIKTSADYTGRINIIGTNLNQEKLLKLFK